MTKYLIDTCVWRDFFEDRIGKSGRDLGKDAGTFILKAISKEDQLLFSSETIKELRKDYSEQEVENALMLLILSSKLTRIETTKNEIEEAEARSIERSLPFVDCLIAIQARNQDAIVVSQDKHFLMLKDIADSRRP